MTLISSRTMLFCLFSMLEKVINVYLLITNVYTRFIHPYIHPCLLGGCSHIGCRQCKVHTEVLAQYSFGFIECFLSKSRDQESQPLSDMHTNRCQSSVIQVPVALHPHVHISLEIWVQWSVTDFGGNHTVCISACLRK